MPNKALEDELSGDAVYQSLVAAVDESVREGLPIESSMT